MKIALFALAIATVVIEAKAEPVKWVDGKITEASAWKLRPRFLEFTSERGTEKVELNKLDPDWVKLKFPEEDAATLQATLNEAEAVLKGIKARIEEVDELISDVDKLSTEARALEQENGRLKTELLFLRKTPQKRSTKPRSRKTGDAGPRSGAR